MTDEPADDGIAVILTAHGSRDPRAAEHTRALAAAVAAARPRWDVHAAYLDHSLPRPAQLLGALQAAGRRRAVLVPLLLTAAYHGKVDVPAEITTARAAGLRIDVDVADVLGPRGRTVDPLLVRGLARRLDEARTADGTDPLGSAAAGSPAALSAAAGSPAALSAAAGSPAAGWDAVVLAAAGTRDGSARATVGRVAAALGEHLGVPCTVAYASAAPPSAGVSVARFRAAGAERVGLASYFLAPGLLYDATVRSARAAGAVAVAAPLGDAAELVRLVQARVDVLGAARTVAHAA